MKSTIVIVSIGNELLIGQIQNTNAFWMADQFTQIGYEVSAILTIADKQVDILDTLTYWNNRVNVIVLTGGLGPTKDDITKQVLAKWYGVGLRQDTLVRANIKTLFEKHGSTISENSLSPSYVPENCEILFNEKGTAPGMLFNTDSTVLIALPGVPYEMKWLMRRYVLPMLMGSNTFDIKYQNIRTIGLIESEIAARILDIERSLPQGAEIAYLPALVEVTVRITVKGNGLTEIQKILDGLVYAVKCRLGDAVYTTGNLSISQIVGQMLMKKGASLATAESCTGGYLAHLITAHSGSSSYYVGSVIAYSNEIKSRHLDVPNVTIEKHGVVSRIVVEYMIKGLLKQYTSDYAISVSGVAGPHGGTKEKPVGMVWIAVGNRTKIVSKKYNLPYDRIENIQSSALLALDLMRRFIKKEDMEESSSFGIKN